ncbi:MAG: mannose-1-phosphate guanylyltransferase/mannose-6-phosphate isomerase [Candidatus Hydrothermarchaeota archaeon]|nr:MAG: mannose-1-phosphate guanylyltransferase/mannose-6-phosphate isomerase [Candidatus Hydrothermarchaeota archaeon]
MKYVVLAGGSGTRLWPLSRELYPKQFHPLVGDKTLLQQTVERCLKYVNKEDIIVVTSEKLYFQVLYQLKGVIAKKNILSEPMGKNTAPAIALASLYIGDENFLVMPSDHVMSKEFLETAEKAEELADNYLVTFGIKPEYPATGYGYIKVKYSEKLGNSYRVEKFIEKPEKEEAEKLIKENCLWNSGIFLFNSSILKEEFNKHLPEIARYMKSYEEFLKSYEKLPNISIDYGILEKSSRVAVVPYSGEWHDIGSWESIYKLWKKDENSNAIRGNVVAVETRNSLIYGEDRLVSTIGVENLLVIDTKDALLVASKEKSQEVKKIVEKLKNENRREAEFHATVYKPWGYYTVLEEGKRYKVKRLCIYPGESISLQMHHHRAEHWIVVKGTAKITLDDKEIYLHENESTYVPRSTKHRVENPGRINLYIIEVQTGEYLEEDDIVRFEDGYGRR